MNVKTSATTVRDIIEIDEGLCDGCGQCLVNCAEGALTLTNGKARLVSDIYCDGLGACLGHCPTGALKIIRRPAPDFDEEAAMDRVRGHAAAAPRTGGRQPEPPPACPGARARTLTPLNDLATPPEIQTARRPGLAFWPIQLKLAPPEAPAFDSPVLVLASDCSGFTGPAFHQTFLTEGHPLLMACPKLDETGPYIDKMTAILKNHPAIKELRVPMMSVPCCGGLGYIAAQAVKRAGREGQVVVRAWIVTPEGRIGEESIR